MSPAGVARIARAEFDGSGVMGQGKRTIAVAIAVVRVTIRIHSGEPLFTYAMCRLTIHPLPDVVRGA